MAAALVQVCVDPRLNHELLRIQVRQKLDSMRLNADRIFILNEIGGNVGANFRNTVELLVRQREPVVFAAVLHHDDCVAASAGLRMSLDAGAQEMAAHLSSRNIKCPVLKGNIRTENNHLIWADETEPGYTPFTFRIR